MLWIALHLPSLALEAFIETLDEADASKAIALLEETKVAAANAPAQALGIVPSMKRSTALTLAPGLLIGQRHVPNEMRALEAVAQAALAFTPSVALEGPQTVLLEVGATLRLFGGLPRLLASLRKAVAPLRRSLRIATAPTALGAALLSHWRSDLEIGPHSIDRTLLGHLLDEAPIWLLGRSRDHWEALQGMGLQQLGDLRRLPRTGLARRFGPELLIDLDRARGDAPDPRRWTLLPKRFSSRVELFARAEHAEQLMQGARVLLGRLLAWSSGWHARVAGFTLRLHHEARCRPGDAVLSPVTPLILALTEASADAAHLETLLVERLARVELPAPVLELSLDCDDLVSRPPPNGELLPTPAGEREGLVRLVDRLQSRLGGRCIQRLRLVEDHRPECDTVGVPVNEPMASYAMPQATPGRPLSRPVWVLREPKPLGERASQPLLDGRPLRLVAGPERIESGWWDAGLATRDYFIAQTADDALVWIYRSRLPLQDDDAGWFLHGRFG